MNLSEIILKMGEEPAEKEQAFDRFSKSKYIPIGYLQDKLDHLFTPFGWSWEIITDKVVLNEVMVRGRLTISIEGMTKVIDGAGATMIQETSEEKRLQSETKERKVIAEQREKGYISKEIERKDFSPLAVSAMHQTGIYVPYKIKNTLRKDFPSASAFAFRNACKSLGKWFGRDLNRDNAPEYAATFIKGVQDVRKEIKGLPNLQALNEYKENNTEWIDKGWFISALTKQEEAFKTLPNPGEQLKIGK